MRGRRYRLRKRVGQRPHRKPGTEPEWLDFFRRWGDHRQEQIDARRAKWERNPSAMLKDFYSLKLMDVRPSPLLRMVFR